MRRLLAPILLATLALLAAPLVQAESGAPTVAVGSDNGAAIKGARRVAIDQFGVEFVTVLKASGSGGGNSTSVQAELRGVPDAAMQALTDRVYRDTVEALTAAGFEVVDMDAVRARPEYAELEARMGKPAPYVIDDTGAVSRIFAPAGMKAYFQTAGGRGTLSDRITALDGANGARASALAKALDLHFVRFHFFASFGTAAGSKGFLANIARRASSSIEAGPVLYPNETQLQIVSQDGQRIFRTSSRSGVNGAFYVDRPVQGAADGFALVDVTTAEARQSDNTSNALSMGLALLIGGRARGTSNTSAAVTLDEATFERAYLPMIGGARDALVERLKGAR